MHKDELTKKAHVSFHDQDEAAVVASVLADDAHFQEKARLVAAAKVSESASVAEREAKSYAPNRGAHRDLIVRLLLTQADEPWQPRGGLGRDYLPNLFRPAVWVDAPLEEGDARRCRERWATLWTGARRLAQFGARQCIRCGTRLGADRFRHRSRPTHCSSCEIRVSANIRKSHRSEIREAPTRLQGNAGDSGLLAAPLRTSSRSVMHRF